MKLTIIIPDNAVYKDGVVYFNIQWDGTPEKVRALQWNDTSGWIEFDDGSPNENIYELPDWANNSITAWDVENNNFIQNQSKITVIQNKAIAQGFLFSTDWVEIPSVTDISNNPHLLNKEEFLTYRAKIRVLAVTPPINEVNWEQPPSAQWSS